jgi:hypothetical protein
VVVCSVTVLALLFGPGHHCQVDHHIGNTATRPRPVIIEIPCWRFIHERAFKSQIGSKFRWQNRRNIRRVSIITWPLLTTTPPRIITIRPSIITQLASTKKPSITQLRLTNIASSLTNTPRPPTLTLINDDATGAETQLGSAFVSTPLKDVPTRQGKQRAWELRAGSLAWLVSRATRARCKLLAPVYGWFTEGFDTRDLKEAKALLEELAA